MKHLSKTSEFLLWTCGMMIVIGVIQIGFGFFKIYNPEEEAFEATSAYKEVQNVTPHADILLSLIKNKRPRIERYLETLSHGQRTKTIKKINEFLSIYDQQNKIDRFPIPTKSRQEDPDVIHHHGHTHKISNIIEAPKDEPTLWEPDIINTPANKQSPEGFRENILHVFFDAMMQSILWKIDVFIDHDRVHPRGQMKNESITLSAHIENHDELTKVLVHEIAHIIDIYYLKNSIQKPDPSYEYYRINWQDVESQHPGSSASDYLSGYSVSNQYEDFAEAFTFYLFHNKEFAERAKENKKLEKKYNFLNKQLFKGRFHHTQYEKEQIPDYVWDVTKIPLKDDARLLLFYGKEK